MKDYKVTTETLGYVTAEDQTNTDEQNLVAGSQDVIIDQQRKVSSRNGFTRLGTPNEASAPVRQAFTWNTSTGTELVTRVQDDEVEFLFERDDRLSFTSAYSFDGVSNVVDLPSGAIIAAASDITIAAWINIDTSPERRFISRFYGSSTGNRSGSIGYTASGGYNLQVRNAAGVAITLDSNVTTIGEWVHVAATWNQTTEVLSIYVNGLLKGTSSLAGPSASGASVPKLGNSVDSADVFFDGKMQDVRIYTAALTAQEVAYIYNRVNDLTTNLDGHYKMTEGSGTVAVDSAGGDDGTLVGVSHVTDRPTLPSDIWLRITDGFSTTITPRFTTWYDDDEALDIIIFVFGDANLYEWNGAVATIASTTATTITKNGTETWGQARFYATGNKTVIINGTEYTYTGGEGTTTLTGISPDPTGEEDNSEVTQKIVTQVNKPQAGVNNNTIGTFENQIFVGSDETEEVLVSSNDDYTSFTFSSPRVPGEGALLTLDDPVRGFGILSTTMVIFGGRSSIYTADYFELAVGSTLTETLNIKKLKTGISQSAMSQEFIVPVGNSLMFLSNEPAFRELNIPENIEGPQLRTLSNPIKPDFDAETWTNGAGMWFKNAIYLSAPTNGRVYRLEFVEDADGRLRRFWQAPQNLPVRAFSRKEDSILGHSNGNPETYILYAADTFSDVNSSDEKLAITATAAFAYRNYGDRVNLKNFDEHFSEGEISPSTELELTLNYGFGGQTQQILKTIDGADQDILSETLQNVSLGQASLGSEPLGGSVNAPSNTAKFRVIFEIAKEDFHEMQAIYKTDDVDKFWSILSHGPNAQLSRRMNITIKK